VRLLSARAPAARASSSRAQMAMSCFRFERSSEDGDCSLQNFANVLKTLPRTSVINGATPPAIIERRKAGRRKRWRSRRGKREKSNRTEGFGGEYASDSWGTDVSLTKRLDDEVSGR